MYKVKAFPLPFKMFFFSFHMYIMYQRMFNSCCHENKLLKYHLRSECLNFAELFLEEIILFVQTLCGKSAGNSIWLVSSKKKRWANLCISKLAIRKWFMKNISYRYVSIQCSVYYLLNRLCTYRSMRKSSICYLLYKLCVIDCSNHLSFCIVYLSELIYILKECFFFFILTLADFK